MKHYYFLLCFAISLIPGFVAGQLYSPGGNIGTNQSGAIGIGIHTNQSDNPLSIFTPSNSTAGLLSLKASVSQVQDFGGNWITVKPDFAIRLQSQATGLSAYTVFNLASNGELAVGNLSLVPAAILNTFTSVYSSLGVYAETDYIKLYANQDNGDMVWGGSNNFNIRYGDLNALPIVNLTSQGKMGLNVSPQAALHIKSTFAENSEAGNVNGIFIEHNGHLPGNYSFKINSAWGEIFSITDRGNVSITNTTSANSPSGDLFGLKITNNDGRKENFAFEIETQLGKILDITNSGHMHLGENLNFTSPDNLQFRLYVENGIRTEKIRVDVATNTGWADYVFEDDYQLMSIEDLKKFIAENKHLPGVPSAQQVKEEGIDLAEMNKILLEKIEELTLRIIELEERIN